MRIITRVTLVVAMVLLSIVSMWTTYISVRDSILPEPVIKVDLGRGTVWDCSVFALGLSVAIGLMLFALKMAIIDEQKRLNVVGLIGMTVIAFISISFNLDVLYRVADRDFFIRYSNSKMRTVYENYLSELQTDLLEKRASERKIVARQEGELDAEIQGLREAPAGYGPIAKSEDYELILLRKAAEVELESVEEALVKKEEADALLRLTSPQTLDEIDQLQNELRVVVKDVGAVSGVRLPDVVKMDSPLFAVFAKLFDFRNVGIKEIFFVILAFILDLGDIVGYSLIPDKPKKRTLSLAALPDFGGPEVVLPKAIEDRAEKPATALLDEPAAAPLAEVAEETRAAERRARRPFYFRRR